MVLLPGDDLGLLPLPIWHVLSLPAGLLAEGDQSDQGLGVAQSLMGLLPCPLVEMSIPNLEIRIDPVHTNFKSFLVMTLGPGAVKIKKATNIP